MVERKAMMSRLGYSLDPLMKNAVHVFSIATTAA